MVYIFVCVGGRHAGADIYKIYVLYIRRHILIKFIAGWKSEGGRCANFLGPVLKCTERLLTLIKAIQLNRASSTTPKKLI